MAHGGDAHAHIAESALQRRNLGADRFDGFLGETHVNTAQARKSQQFRPARHPDPENRCLVLPRRPHREREVVGRCQAPAHRVVHEEGEVLGVVVAVVEHDIEYAAPIRPRHVALVAREEARDAKDLLVVDRRQSKVGM